MEPQVLDYSPAPPRRAPTPLGAMSSLTIGFANCFMGIFCLVNVGDVYRKGVWLLPTLAIAGTATGLWCWYRTGRWAAAVGMGISLLSGIISLIVVLLM